MLLILWHYGGTTDIKSFTSITGDRKFSHHADANTLLAPCLVTLNPSIGIGLILLAIVYPIEDVFAPSKVRGCINSELKWNPSAIRNAMLPEHVSEAERVRAMHTVWA
jgi:hypothetical protein